MKVAIVEAGPITPAGNHAADQPLAPEDIRQFASLLEEQRTGATTHSDRPPTALATREALRLADKLKAENEPGDAATAPPVDTEPNAGLSWATMVHAMTRDSRQVARLAGERAVSSATSVTTGAEPVEDGTPSGVRHSNRPQIDRLRDQPDLIEQQAAPITQVATPIAGAAAITPTTHRTGTRAETTTPNAMPVARSGSADMSVQTASLVQASNAPAVVTDRTSPTPDARLPRGPVEGGAGRADTASTLVPEVQAASAASPAPERLQAGTPQTAGASSGDAMATLPPSISMATAPTLPAAGPAGTLAPHPVPGMMAHLAVPVGSSHWGAALGETMMTLAQGGDGQVRHIELRLDPPHLGPLHVSLQLQGELASAAFVSAQPAVRAALEAALPLLQQTLADAGIQLGQTSVGEQSHQQEAESPTPQSRANLPGGIASGSDDLTPPSLTQPLRGLIDTFA